MSRNGDAPLVGRRALVTGVSKGIGEATAKRLAGYGAAVVVNSAGSARDAVGGEADYVVGSTLFLDSGMLLYPKFV